MNDAIPESARARTILRDAQGRIDEDVSCRRCGYNLRGLLPAGVCPECATPIGRSLQGDLLRFCDPDWVRKLARGMNWIMAAIGVGILVGCGGSFVPLVAGGRFAASVPFFSLLTGAVSFIGYWLVTTPDPGRLIGESGPTARQMVRGAQVAGMVASVVHAFIGSGGIGMHVAVAVSSALGVVGTFAIFIYARQLALRIPDVRLASRTRLVMWGLVVIGLFGVVMAATAFWSLRPGLTTWTTMPAAPGTPAVVFSSRTPTVGAVRATFLTLMVPVLVTSIGGLVFSIWALVLIIQYRRAFQVAAWIAEDTWAGPRPKTAA